jgi:membrane protein implicated in regulation of membrane protease activity
MPRREWIETLVMIVVILLWWPYVFAPLAPGLFAFAGHPLYRQLLFVVTPIPLVVIFVLRLRRYRSALREAQEAAEQRAQVDTERRLR